MEKAEDAYCKYKYNKNLKVTKGFYTDSVVNFLKWYCDQNKNSLFYLDFKSMLIKYQLTQVLSSDFKKTPVYFNWNFLTYWSAMTNFKVPMK